ncbi:MAG: alpha-L-fucosidase [Planctomycetes bacterium]|nr:alpha-L-fucosidase [Planctomycetota bacterium]
MRSRLGLSLLFLAASACASEHGYTVEFVGDPQYRAPSGPERDEAEVARALATVSEWDPANLSEQLADSDVVFVGKVLEVGPSPGFGVSGWAGPAWQPVLYEVEDTWKGRLPQKFVVVSYPLWDESPLVRMDPIRLNPQVWRRGAERIVWAKLDSEPYCGNYGHLGFVAPWDLPGPLPLTDAMRALPEIQATCLAARLSLPTPEQVAWLDREVGMFVHIAPQTWQDSEEDDLSTPLSAIDPAQLDTDQWVSVAESMGARSIVFVAKHEGGFCWWQTDTTDFSVKGTPWRGGKGDVLADLSRSCAKRGMKLGVYISPQDKKHGVGGGGKCKDPAKQGEYEALFRAQLTEVLSRYGEMSEVWFDGSLVFDVSDVLRQHAPHAVVFQGPSATIRWVGNEDGIAPDPAWNGARYDPKTWGNLTSADGDPNGDRFLPNECDARIRATWFWKTNNESTLKTVEQLVDMYERSVGRGAVMLLNVTPDRSGRMPDADAKRAAEFGAEVRRRYGKAIAETSGDGDVVELTLPAMTTIDRVLAMEDVAKGERVRRYAIEAIVDGKPGWTTLATGTSIGHEKIDRIDPVRVLAVRVRVLDVAARPAIRRLAVFDTRRSSR